ncbi:MAG: hypothetical protein JXK07_01355 [Spirochaetes bacterium]|nr:hypothetical protein [Spirochaetota bacterium]MBN2770271.1 hypothetical protein [Spirochaetota bacterium]
MTIYDVLTGFFLTKGITLTRYFSKKNKNIQNNIINVCILNTSYKEESRMPGCLSILD